MQSNETSSLAEQEPDRSEAGSFRAADSAVLAATEQREGGRIPELLAPAGDWDCARAAVENGADAIYFGLEKFNARMRAHNFTEADLPKLMEFLRRRGVKGYVTFNTLVFENEMAEAEQHLRAIIAAGVDAAIVQDAGICRLIRQLSPDFPIHASTQMTITSAGGVTFAKELGCNLVVLARECSLKEIEKIVTSEECRATMKEASVPASRITHHASLPLEVFVHGALCVAYSGQCLTSEALGGRSANRGECAQACRMPYDLIADGRQVPLGDRKYLLSPQDLAGLEMLPELIQAGVASLKIEGRLKSPEYVANITRIYRNALDSSATCRVSSAESKLPSAVSGTRHSTFDTRQYEMEMSFSRGLYTGWFRGINNQELVHGRFGKKRGVYLGEVESVRPEGVRVRLMAPLKPGDGVVFDSGHPEEKEEGGRVYEIRNPKPDCRTTGADFLTFGHGDINFDRIHAGDKVWKTSDPELDRRLRQSFAGDRSHFQRPLQLEVHGRAGQPLSLIARDELGHVVRADSTMPLAKAEKQPLTVNRLREQLGRLGGTPFKLGELKNQLEGEVLLPISELNCLRRQAVQELESVRAQPKRWTLLQSSSRHEEALTGIFSGIAEPQPKIFPEKPSAIIQSYTPKPLAHIPGSPSFVKSDMSIANAPSTDQAPLGAACFSRTPPRPHMPLLTELEKSAGVTRSYKHAAPNGASALPSECEPSGQASSSALAHLIVLVRKLAQLEAALKCGVETLYCEFEDPKKYREAVGCFRNSAFRSLRSALFVAPPRIFKTGEEWTLNQVRACEADGYLIRNYDHLRFFANDRRIGDFSLNVANRLTADYFKNRFGLERVTVSYDLNFAQLEALLRAAPPEWFEVTIHQHIPMFHMEHCVFCAFLSKGTDYTNCGRPCDKHDLKLRDRVGAEHPVKADVGCRNTVFNALAQTGAEYVSRMLDLGVRHFRIEFLNETPEQVAQTISKYRQLLRGEISGPQLWRELKLLNQLGVTRGQLGHARG